MNDVLLNKLATISRCIQRIHEEYGAADNDELATNYTKQDSVILNIQRACEAVIDIGTHIIRKKQLEVPQTRKEIFVVLEKNKIIDHELSVKLQAMVGFRNIAVHDYNEINLDIIRAIIKNHLNDLLLFAQKVVDMDEA